MKHAMSVIRRAPDALIECVSDRCRRPPNRKATDIEALEF
jgi:hypothetical protein